MERWQKDESSSRQTWARTKVVMGEDRKIGERGILISNQMRTRMKTVRVCLNLRKTKNNSAWLENEKRKS